MNCNIQVSRRASKGRDTVRERETASRVVPDSAWKVQSNVRTYAPLTNGLDASVVSGKGIIICSYLILLNAHLQLRPLYIR
jgi:hypothetical protein